MTHRTGPVGNRAVLAAKAAELRAKGLLLREIADALCVSYSYTQALVADPLGLKAQARKASYAAPCVDCGALTSGSEGRKVEPRCLACNGRKQGAAMLQWPADRIIKAIQEWNDLYGSPPAINDWNPTAARHAMHDEARAARFEQANGRWPWFNLVTNRFGTWNNAIAAAGFEPRKSYGSRENAKNRQRKNPAKRLGGWQSTTGGTYVMEAIVLHKNGAGWVEVGRCDARSYKDAVEQLAKEAGEYCAIPASMVFVVAPVQKLVAEAKT